MGAASPNFYEMINAGEARVYAHANFEFFSLESERRRASMARLKHSSISSKRDSSICCRLAPSRYSFAKETLGYDVEKPPCVFLRQSCCQGW
jgi:hypothetical protein